MALTAPSESPAIVVKEVDLTSGVPNIPTSTGAMVGNFSWGPCDIPTLVSNEATLVGTFGSPDTVNTQMIYISLENIQIQQKTHTKQRLGRQLILD